MLYHEGKMSPALSTAHHAARHDHHVQKTPLIESVNHKAHECTNALLRHGGMVSTGTNEGI